MNIGFIAGLIVVVPLVMALYLLPSLVAMRRGHPQAAPIFVINLFLGITGVFWVLTLAWAVSDFSHARRP